MSSENARNSSVPETPRLISEETVSLYDGPVNLELGSDNDVVRIVDPVRDLLPGAQGFLDTSADCFVIDPNSLGPNTGYKALPDGESVVLGRLTPGRFYFSRHVSGHHVQLDREGDLIRITDLNSDNGTFLMPPTNLRERQASSSKKDIQANIPTPVIDKQEIAEMPTPPTSFRMAGETIGRSPAEANQDTFFIDDENCTLGVFDGMGGYRGSEEASAMAAWEVEDRLREVSIFTPRDLAELAVQEALNEAHHRIYDYMEESEYRERMAASGYSDNRIGTTAIVAKVFEAEPGSPYVVLGSAGDSRAYLFRQGKIEYVSLDHTRLYLPVEERRAIQQRLSHVVNLAELGDADRKRFEDRSTISSCLGGPEDAEPVITIASLDLCSGDQLLLTSDAIPDNLTDSEIEDIVSRAAGKKPDEAVHRLIAAAITRSQDKQHRRHKSDDMTAILLACD